MLRALFFGALLLLAGSATAHAERICDIEKRWVDDTLPDKAPVTFRGRISKTYDYDPAWRLYSYEVTDSCGTAFILHTTPIKCRGQVAIAGEYSEWDSDAGILTAYVTSAACG
jgi:hypothetical protein